jgi:MFS transporter, OFA family, oxalate/formate antiporter
LCWFPERKGLITGIAVAGFGAGAIVLSVVARVAFNHGWEVLRFFCWMGPIWGAVVLVSALFLSTPARVPGAPPPPRPSFLSLIRRRDYQRLVVGMYCISFAGLTVIGSLEPMGRAANLAPALATLAISLLALGNSVGRITWGGVYDRVGRVSVPAALFGTGLSALAMLALGGTQPGYLIAAALSGLTYGSTTVLFAAEVATLWGPAVVAVVYPFLSMFNGLAALTGPAITGALYDRTGSYATALVLSAAVAIVGAALVWRWPHLDEARPTGDNGTQTAPVAVK